jgi:hypothetical protein
MYYEQTMSSAAAFAPEAARKSFIRKTYMHLFGAIVAFAALTTGIILSGAGATISQTLLGSQFGWLIVMGAFIGVSFIAERWAQPNKSKSMQYLGLGVFVVAEAIVFTPLLYLASVYSDPAVIPAAGVMTLLVFGGLTATVFITGKDFSFLGKFLTIMSLASFGFIAVSLIFGFGLGALFAAAMVVLASGYILYYTSKIMHHYPVGSHVAASLALFSAVALLFWYILRLFMSRD